MKRAQSTRKRFPKAPKSSFKNILRLAIFMGIALIIGGLAVFVTSGPASAASASSATLPAANTTPNPKQVLVASQAKWHQLGDKTVHAKGTLPASTCPVDLSRAPLFDDFTIHPERNKKGSPDKSFASVISMKATPYFVFGQTDAIAVERIPLDPCQAIVHHQKFVKTKFATPTHVGDIVITSVKGDIVSYKTSLGASGSFNYVTGQFRS